MARALFAGDELIEVEKRSSQGGPGGWFGPAGVALLPQEPVQVFVFLRARRPSQACPEEELDALEVGLSLVKNSPGERGRAFNEALIVEEHESLEGRVRSETSGA